MHDPHAVPALAGNAPSEPPEVEVVIEVPRGSFLKRGSTGHVDFISPLACPFNYGSVPKFLGLEGDLLDALVLGPRLSLGTRIRVKAWGAVTLTDRGYDVQEMEKCDAGITECDVLIAQTGGVAVTSRSAGGRALSVLPPHHIVIARRDQLVADLPAAFAFLQKKYTPDFPSMISFITGPSRTGDIERILVLGAHGPKKLTIFCV